MPFRIIRQDICLSDTDAVVSGGNAYLRMEGGVSGAIFRAAGEKELTAACAALAPIKTAEAVISPGFRLKAKYIIHTLGPVYSEHSPEESSALLRKAYLNSLQLAEKYKCRSIALPLISSGSFGFPAEKALRVAEEAIRDFMQESDMDIILAVYGHDAFELSRKLMGPVQSYIDENYVESHRFMQRSGIFSSRSERSEDCSLANYSLSDDLFESSVSRPSPCFSGGKGISFSELDESFSQSVLRLIDQKGKTDAQVYKKANIDRRVFSKLRSSKNYSPSKRTALSLCIGLELNLRDTRALLEKAGFSLSHSILSDVIVEYFIVNGIYDVIKINEVLFAHDQSLLGS